MGEQKMPEQNPAGRQGNQNPQQDRESASRQPGKQAPDQNQQPKERASNPSRDPHDDAARRQSRQDPLQNRGR